MRFRNVFLAATIVGVVAFLCLRPTAHAQDVSNDPVMDIFDSFRSRSLKVHSQIDGSALDQSPVGRTYRDIEPRRSILFYDCLRFRCDQGDEGELGYLTFKNIFGLAAKFANPAKPDAVRLFNDWFKDVNESDMDDTIAQIAAVANQDFQLLAVANRMDMALFEDGYWTGAEIHFAYGPKPKGDGAVSFTAILEFELAEDLAKGIPRAHFKDMADGWRGLSRLSDAEYTAELRKTLITCGLPLAGSNSWIKRVKLRTNHKLDDSNWFFTQMVLAPNGGKFMPAKLDDQIIEPISAGLWKGAETSMQSGPKQYNVPEEYVAPAGLRYDNMAEPLSTPKSVCGASEQTRNVLALQRCTGCHTTAETHTKFTHIANRVSGKNAVLSDFLVGYRKVPGTEPNLKPDLINLYIPNDKVVLKVDVNYKTYVGGSDCTTLDDHPRKTTVWFHDIARRTLFLSAVLNGAVVDGPPGLHSRPFHPIE